MLEQYKVGDMMDDYAFIRQLQIKEDRKGQLFLSLTLQDKTRMMDAKYWHIPKELARQFNQGQVVHFKGELTEFNGRPQIKLLYLEKATGPVAEISLYIEGAPLTTKEMKEEIYSYIDAMSTDLKQLMTLLFKQYGDEFFTAAAAKTNHHSFAGGLSYHTLCMLRLAKDIAKHYKEVDTGLLYAGVICHDFGKIWEMTPPPTVEYTLAGELLGHLTMMSEAITVLCLEHNIPLSQDILCLKHLILAHHGKLEFASPVVPKLLEAELLHQIDYMDASMNMMTNALDHTACHQFTDRINAMEGRSFYKK